MKEITLRTYGKINLGLDVINKRQDDYHNIETIMQEIDIYDRLDIKLVEGNNIEIKSNSSKIPLGPENLVYKSWEKLKKYRKDNFGVEVYIEKKIPVAAGLAGGSTNGAGALKGLNILWNLGLSDRELMEIAGSLGADMPFCIIGGTARASGIGEKLERISSFKDKPLVLLNMGIPISTRDVYKSLDLRDNKRLAVDKIVEAIEEDDLDLINDNIINKMETIVIGKNPVIEEIKEDMRKTGGRVVLMSGSGPTVFAIYEDFQTRDRSYEYLLKKYMESIVIKTKTI